MKMTHNGRSRERQSKFTINDFIESNIDDLQVQYLEANPQDAHKIDDWDLDCVYDWANSSSQLSRISEIMTDLYLEHIIS